MDSCREEVERLEQLKAEGIIDSDEFARRKKELVDSYVLEAAGAASRHSHAALESSGVYRGIPQAVVKLRGLPFGCSESDIKTFLDGFTFAHDPIKFQLTAEGRHSGMCYVRLASIEEATRALSKNKQYLGQRYIEVFPSSEEELQIRTVPVAATCWVKMRGLPFSATKGDIKAFFDGFNVNDAAIYLVNYGGRASGEAFVQFANDAEAQKALLKDKESIGMRYIELFLTTREDCDSTIARYRGDTGYGYEWDGYGGFGGGGFDYGAGYGGFGGWYGGGGGKGYGFGGKGGAVSGDIGAIGDGGDHVVRVRGLPFRANEQDIATFFIGLPVLSSCICFGGGRPTGEGFVEFADQAGLDGALQRNRQLMGTRYIEVFHSSKAEMETAGAMSAFEGGDIYGGGGVW